MTEKHPRWTQRTWKEVSPTERDYGFPYAYDYGVPNPHDYGFTDSNSRQR